MKRILISPKRREAVLDLIADSGDVVYVRQIGETKVTLADEGNAVVAFVEGEVTPAVQSFLSRIPAHDAGEGGESEEGNEQQETTDGTSAWSDTRGSGSPEEDPSGGNQPAGGDADHSDQDESSGDGAGDSQSPESAQADSNPGQGSDSGDPGDSARDRVPGQQQRATNAPDAESPAPGEDTGGVPGSEYARQPSPAVQATGAGSASAAPTRNLFNVASRGYRDPSAIENRAHGGIFGSLLSPEARPPRELIHRARRVMARMIHGGEGEAGARWHAPRIAEKIAGYMREWRVDDRREEDGRPAILVLPDISGSMSKFSAEVLRLACAVQEIGLPGGDIIVVAHSNGEPEELRRHPHAGVKKIALDPMGSEFCFYGRLIAQHNVRVVLAAADADARWLYSWFLNETSVELYWLDPANSKNIGHPRLRPIERIIGADFLTESARKRAHYADGCGTAEHALDALQLMLQKRP